MGMQLLALAKLKLLGSAAHGPGLVLSSLLGFFIIKIPIGSTISRSFADVASSSTLFFYRLSQIIFHGQDTINGRRWERVIRLVRERATHVPRSSTRQSDEASLNEVSMIAL